MLLYCDFLLGMTAGRDPYASQGWTDAQVARFAQCPLTEILRRWDTAAEAFASLPDDPTMGPPARWAFGDAGSTRLI
jgi:hypothetical protein